MTPRALKERLRPPLETIIVWTRRERAEAAAARPLRTPERAASDK
jgi:hypothetical protein